MLASACALGGGGAPRTAPEGESERRGVLLEVSGAGMFLGEGAS
jgi:hypothetical protein